MPDARTTSPGEGRYDWIFGEPDNRWRSFDALARAYYINDQRIEWSGQEATFGVEAILAGGVDRQVGAWKVGLEGELFFNQPFDRNILVDTQERVSYRGNFEIDILEISQLFLTARSGDLLLAFGKMATPFGRTYFPLYQNDLSDAPFIRTESILWRETGLMAEYSPGFWVFTAALVNGGPDRDANSSKALISRIGVDADNFALGASVKWQDGIGSEDQKTFNNHVGVDVMFRGGPFRMSAEAIYDQYGFRRPWFDPQDITWGRSIYYRDQNRALHRPITGLGYYVNLDYQAQRWTGMFNYGEFYPRQIGDPLHDVTTRRGIVKVIFHIARKIDSYSMLLVENDVANAQAGRTRRGINLLTGFQVAL